MSFKPSFLPLTAGSLMLLQACAGGPPPRLTPSQTLAQNPNYETSVDRGIPSIRTIDSTGSFVVEVRPEGRELKRGDPKFLVGIQNYSEQKYRFSAQKVSIRLAEADGELQRPIAALSFDEWEAYVQDEHGASDLNLGMALIGTALGVAAGAAGGFDPTSMTASNQLFDASNEHMAMADSDAATARAMVDGVGASYWLETDIRPGADMQWGVVTFVGLPEDLSNGTAAVMVEVPGETVVFPFALGPPA